MIDRLVLAGLGPPGGPGLTGTTRRMLVTTGRAVTTFRHPKELLFFTRTPAGRGAARQYLARLKERSTDREPAVRASVLRTELAAVSSWGQATADHSALTGPVLVVHGDSDRLVSPANATALVDRLPTATLIVYTDSGHEVVSQYHAAFVAAADEFLRR